MGGTALGFQAARLPQKEYFALESNVRHAFSMGWSGTTTPPTLLTIPAYSQKESFGDADFLFVGRAMDWERFIKNIGEYVPSFSGDIARNDPVISVGVQLPSPQGVFQVDFIYAGENADAARIMRTYFAYNDLGNLMGRIAHRMGLRWGQDGLAYVLRDPENKDRVLGEFNLTERIGVSESFALMGYDWGQWTMGFNTLEDIFQYVASSRYFSPDIYLLHNRNAISRARDAKRKSYAAFLKWLQENDNLPSMVLGESEREYFNAQIFHRLCVDYPDFAKWFHNTMEAHYARRRAGNYLNGDVVAQITGLQGKELGAFITELRAQLQRDFAGSFYGFDNKTPDYAFNQWVLDNPGVVEHTVARMIPASS